MLNILMVSFDARGVGFLRYFQLKQLPNFLLASPILSLALSSIIYYAKSRPEVFFSLGFQASIEEKNSSALLFSPESSPRSNIARFPEKSYSKIQGITFIEIAGMI
jgi:phosphatidylinositol glycan class V